MNQPQVKNIAVVRSRFRRISQCQGISGFRDFGGSVTVFEKDSEVGGVWSSSRRYPALHWAFPDSVFARGEAPTCA